jgi:hypothetical protein
MLSVTPALPVTETHAGVGRVTRARRLRGVSGWPLFVPPVPVLRAFYAAHPDFRIGEQDIVSSVVPLSVNRETTATERTIIKAIRSSPDGVMRRRDLYSHCVTRHGMNPYTFEQHLYADPFIVQAGPELWSLRGTIGDHTLK